MKKKSLSWFRIVGESRHKHVRRIMRMTGTVLFAAVFSLQAENVIAQKITLQGDNLSLKDYHLAR